MSSINKAIIIGNLGADPDIRYTQSNTAVANLSVATSERYKDKSGEWKERTEWHRVVAWDRKAEIAQEYMHKGSKVYVEGPIQTRSWEDKDGQKRYSTEIKAMVIRMLDSRANSSNAAAEPSGSKYSEQVPANDISADNADIDDDLPF